MVPDLVNNLEARNSIRDMSSAIILCWQIQLKFYVLEKRNHKILYCLINIVVFYASVIINIFDFQYLQSDDVKIMVAIFIITLLYAMLFSFVTKNIEIVIFSEAKGMFEMK